MENENKSYTNIISSVLIISALILGFAFGFSFYKSFPCKVNITPVFTDTGSLKSILLSALGICKSQMLQFAAIFVSAFTLFSSPVCMAVLAYRGASLGFSVSMTLLSENAVQIIPSVISYGIVTAIIAVFSYASLSLSGKTKNRILSDDNERKPVGFLNHLYLFQLTSGAALIMRVLPAFVFSK